MKRKSSLAALRPAIFLFALVSAAPAGLAEVSRVEVESRTVLLDGRPFGDIGAYEKISGVIHFAFDPANPANDRIVDLEYAPRNDDGLVEADADFMVLRPVDQPASERTLLVEVSNRGGKASMRYFNRGAFSSDPTEPEHFGDGLTMRQGLTLLWVGWQHDVPDQPGRLRLRVPVATGFDGPLTGLVRSDWVVNEATDTLHVGHRGHIAYPVADMDDPANRLTVRDGRNAPRREIPRSQWRFAQAKDGDVEPSRTHIFMDAGFEPGKIYELVYPAEDPRVVGLGLAAIRDVASYAKHDPDALFPAQHTIAWGVSQTGRFLRHFLYQGFNTDEAGRRAYDGLLIHTAGAGRGSFNHRFGQPSRDAHRYSAFFYPTDIFPFTSRTVRDPETLDSDGLFAHARDPEHLPKVFYTNTGYEYWGRAASLIHTSPDGKRDVAPMDNERIYHFASGQHFVDAFPPRERRRLAVGDAYQGNPLDFLLSLRALLVELTEWVREGDAPPPSAYPTLSGGSLVPIDEVEFPPILGLDLPDVIHLAYRADYGPRWSEGIIDNQPPVLGPAFPSLAPQVDRFGNEVGGVRTVEIEAPLATHTPWSLRAGLPGPVDELADFRGSYSPFPLTEDEREARDDPRPSVDSLYPSRAAYLRQAEQAARRLVERGWLLREDVSTAVDRAAAHWDWIHER